MLRCVIDFNSTCTKRVRKNYNSSHFYKLSPKKSIYILKFLTCLFILVEIIYTVKTALNYTKWIWKQTKIWRILLQLTSLTASVMAPEIWIPGRIYCLSIGCRLDPVKYPIMNVLFKAFSSRFHWKLLEAKISSELSVSIKLKGAFIRQSLGEASSESGS